jgi:hypothetical protein
MIPNRNIKSLSNCARIHYAAGTGRVQ